VPVKVFETVPLYESEHADQGIHRISLCESKVVTHGIRNVYPGESWSIAQGFRNGLFCLIELIDQNVRNCNTCRKWRSTRNGPKTWAKPNVFVSVKVFETVGLGEYELDQDVRNTLVESDAYVKLLETVAPDESEVVGEGL